MDVDLSMKNWFLINDLSIFQFLLNVMIRIV
jgi:hypothetical protein